VSSLKKINKGVGRRRKKGKTKKVYYKLEKIHRQQRKRKED